MTHVSDRNFRTFELGDNVYQLADGVIPEIAERIDIKLGNEPNSDDMQTMMNVVGKNRVLRSNAEVEAIDRATQVELVTRSGVQGSLSRSIWTPGINASPDNVDLYMLVGGVANWQDRATMVAGRQPGDVPIYSVAGNRVMDSETEKSNPNVQYFKEAVSRYPTEADYAASKMPELHRLGKTVTVLSYETKSGDEILDRFFVTHPDALQRHLAVVRVANAGVLSALQMREAARKHDPQFDRDPVNPQAFVITDTFPLAATEEQEKDSANFQKAGTALRQLVLTAKKLHEAATGE